MSAVKPLTSVEWAEALLADEDAMWASLEGQNVRVVRALRFVGSAEAVEFQRRRGPAGVFRGTCTTTIEDGPPLPHPKGVALVRCVTHEGPAAAVRAQLGRSHGEGTWTTPSGAEITIARGLIEVVPPDFDGGTP